MFSGTDVYRPSFFEMIAADRLLSSLKPSLVHITTVLARRHSAFAGLRRYSDEIFFGLTFALERHYLHAYDGSFSENFYGLRRIRVETNLPPALERFTRDPTQYSSLLFGAEAVQGAARARSTSPADSGGGSSSSLPLGHSPFFHPLSPSDRRRALFFLATLPYLRGKVEAQFLRWRDQVDAEGFTEVWEDAQHSWLANRFHSGLLRFYPYIHLVSEGLPFLFSLRFLFERSVFFSPTGFFSSQILRRMNMDEMQAGPAVHPPADGTVGRVRTPGLLGLLKAMLSTLSSISTRYFKYFVLTSIFAFKFLEWWYSPANAYYNGGAGGANGAGGGGRKLPVPPPPEAPRTAIGGLEVPEDKLVCPLCLNERTNPAATPTGYVFCYACIHQHIGAHQTCPVTLKPCKIEQIRKIYEN